MRRVEVIIKLSKQSDISCGIIMHAEFPSLSLKISDREKTSACNVNDGKHSVALAQIVKIFSYCFDVFNIVSPLLKLI